MSLNRECEILETIPSHTNWSIEFVGCFVLFLDSEVVIMIYLVNGISHQRALSMSFTSFWTLGYKAMRSQCPMEGGDMRWSNSS